VSDGATDAELILVVDDEPGMRETVVDILDAHGLKAIGVGSARDAIARRASHSPSVAIVDHGLPDMTGLELCTELKAADEDLQVILLTGRATLEAAIAAVGQADEFLTKPVHPDELLRVIRGAMLRHHLRKQNAELIARLQEANSRLEASITDRTRDLEGLSAMAEGTARARGLDEVLDAVVSTITGATGALTTAVYLLDDDSGSLVIRAVWPAEAVMRPVLATTPWGVDPTVTRDAEGGLWMPLTVGGSTLGALVLEQPERVNSSFLQTLAVEAAVALQNAELLARERQTVERLSEISRLKSAFLASVSHELRTPLTAVVGFAQTLGNYGETLSAPDRKHMLERIVVQGERLRRLINNLLDSTALETGTLRISPGVVDAREVARRVIEGLGERGPQVTVDLPADLPALWADEGRLEQILGNLLDNAVKHSPADAPITLSASVTPVTARLLVEDGGPGIDPEFLPRLFDPFTQADTSDSRRQQGVGLGLFIARGLVAAMGGTIEVETPPAGGTRFVVELPRAPR
jgi:signal transduction histidine kinase/FixJ family two-component response regulator